MTFHANISECKEKMIPASPADFAISITQHDPETLPHFILQIDSLAMRIFMKQVAPLTMDPEFHY